jgi:hypothetical protein
MSTLPPTTRTACSPSFCANTRPGARPTPMCCAMPRSSSRPSWTTPCAWAPRRLPPGTTRGCARTQATGLFELLKGLDPAKDQSYFLHRLNQAQLSKTLFPVGELHKTEVRRIAEEIGLPNAKKKDSTGICFIGERPFREFLNRYISHEPGPIKDDRGRTLGQHVGLSFYTLGQRQGLGIGGVKAKAEGGAGQRPARRGRACALVCGPQGPGHPTRCAWCRGTTTPGCCRTRSMPQDASWCAGQPPRRAATPPRPATASRCACTVSARRRPGFRLDFPEAQWAVTPGQSAVLYDGEVCLGGGVIERHQLRPERLWRHRGQGLEICASALAAGCSSDFSTAKSPSETMPTSRLSRLTTGRRRIWCLLMRSAACSTVSSS